MYNTGNICNNFVTILYCIDGSYIYVGGHFPMYINLQL